MHYLGTIHYLHQHPVVTPYLKWYWLEMGLTGMHDRFVAHGVWYSVSDPFLLYHEPGRPMPTTDIPGNGDVVIQTILLVRYWFACLGLDQHVYMGKALWICYLVIYTYHQDPQRRHPCT